MKDKILDALKTKFEGVDAATLSRIAAKLANTTTDEAEIQTVVDGVTFQQVLENYGDARATTAQQTAVKNYESKHGLKDGKPIEAKAPKPAEQKPENKPQDEPEYIKALREQMTLMQKRLDEADKAKITNGRRGKLDDMLKGVPDNLKTIYTQNFEAMTFADDAAFDSWLENSKTSADAVAAAMKAQGGVTTPPKSGGSAGDKPNPIVVARAEKTASQAKSQPSAIIGSAQAK